MRDDRVQAAGRFPAIKGSRIEHAKLIDFIGRNYASDAEGAWFFQNGPQRVYVELEAAPWVWRLQRGSDRGLKVSSHTGLAALPGGSFVDEHGRLFLDTDIGAGIVHSLDMELAADAVERGDWAAREQRFDDLVERFGWRLSPSADRA